MTRDHAAIPVGDMTIVRSAASLWTSRDEDQAWYLVMVEGAEPGWRIRLGARPMVIGRVEPADLVLRDTEVSRRHCAVEAHPKAGLLVTDLNATNGTYVDGKRIAGTVPLAENAILQVGRHVFRCEQRSAPEATRIDTFADELRRAADYVRALLPAPIEDGPIHVEWAFAPSAHLGGDAFGYQWLDREHFAFFLIDVSGHGPSAALHSATIMNVLRNRSLPRVNFEVPAEVVAGLNDTFPMEAHAGMCFSIWYGVYDRRSHRLDYCSAGHHPAYLIDWAGACVVSLQTRNLLVGAVPAYRFRTASVEVPQGGRIYVFSDGAFEIRGEDGREGRLEDFQAQLLVPGTAPESHPDWLLDHARRRAPARAFEDDFTLLRLEFCCVP